MFARKKKNRSETVSIIVADKSIGNCISYLQERLSLANKI
jgi:hypothetical protein